MSARKCRRILIGLVAACALVAAQSASATGFEGCGRYRLRGRLVLAAGATEHVSYRVDEGTRSQLDFDLGPGGEFEKVSALLDQPSELEADILAPLDGTRGGISGLGAIRLRFPDPLRPNRDGGITLIRRLDCRK